MEFLRGDYGNDTSGAKNTLNVFEKFQNERARERERDRGGETKRINDKFLKQICVSSPRGRRRRCRRCRRHRRRLRRRRQREKRRK